MTASTRSRLALAAAVAVVLAIAGYWHFSPYLTLRTLQVAAEARDFETLNRHVDYPLLRESIKGQLQGALAGRMRPPSDNPIAAIAGSLGNAMISGAVEVLVRPVTLASLVRTGEAVGLPGAPPAPAPPAATPPAAPSPPPARSGSPSAPAEPRTEWRLDREGLDRVVFFPRDRPGEQVGLVLERRGFADWILTGLQLPERFKVGSGAAR